MSAAPSVRAAESALLTWQERRALDSADRVWLVLSRGEALDSEADPFLADLLQILEMWCRRCGLDAERAAVHRVGELLDVHQPDEDADPRDHPREQLAEGVDLLPERRLLLVLLRLLHVRL